jgi:hypothetical protein
VERKLFEQWADMQQYDVRVFRHLPHVFVDARTEAAWQAWLARAEYASQEEEARAAAGF